MTSTPTCSGRTRRARVRSAGTARPAGARRVIALAAVLAVLSACSTGRPADPREPAMPSVTTAPLQHSSTDPADSVDEEGAGPLAGATVTPQAVQAAVAFVTAWARPDLDQPTWLAGVSRHATPEYAAALATVDPSAVAAHRITADAVPQTATVQAADVDVPTDAGTIRVVLVLRGGRWLVTDLRPARETP
jgi:hypothetical protein